MLYNILSNVRKSFIIPFYSVECHFSLCSVYSHSIYHLLTRQLTTFLVTQWNTMVVQYFYLNNPHFN